jgi:hypothetical protein
MRIVRRIRPVFFVSIFALLLAVSQGMFASGHAASVPDRITQPIDESNLVKLAGNTRPEANSRNDRGAVSDGLAFDHMFLQLQRSSVKEQELDKLIDELNDRTSPNFHHWLTAETFGRKFGVAQGDIDTVTGWLQSHGFHVNRVYPSRMLIDFSGTAGQIRGAFHTEIHQLDVNGEQHISNMSDPQIPGALAPVVKAIVSLNDFKPHPMYKSRTQYTVAGCGDTTIPTEPGSDCYLITPQDNQTIYNLNPLYADGISGQGQTIALVEDTDTYTPSGGTFASDWNTYRSTFGLSENFPLGTYTQLHPGGCTDPGSTADDGEAAIDVEVASAIAPSAAIELISCKGSTFTFGGLIALQNLVNASGPYPGVVSVSYGECEVLNGAGGNAAFYNTYQQAASEGISVFGSSGDEGPSSCSNEFSAGSEYDVTSLGVSGWTDTPYNVTVGGTDFEDTYNVKEAGASFSTYWSVADSQYYGSALQYIPEIPWNDACASVLISDVATSSFTTYGTGGTCNNSSWDTAATYLSTGAGSGGASNCATGAAGTDQSSYLITTPDCQGYAKPSWQSGASLAGGQAVYGQPTDGVRDIPDVSMFAANGVWGHYEVVCWSDPKYVKDGSAPCTGAPSSWAGFGGTSVASPTMAAIQALVNQETGESWGNPNPIYYQIAQNEYGVAGGSFIGGSCNSSGAGGPGSGCAFNDVTQGDINLACEDNGTLEEAHCFLPSGTYGVDSTDDVTAATLINGGTGYTSAPTCTIAGPTNNSPYLSPTGNTLYAGGTQAACSATVSSGTTTAVWTIAISSRSASGQQVIVGPNTYTLSGTSTTAIATALAASINTGSVATATSSGATVTATAKTTGYAGNFNVSWGTGFISGAEYVVITNTTPGQGPNYVSGITITTAGSGYQPDTPITLTGGGGTGASAVANTSIGTAAQSYQPAYGAAPGYDLATGLGTPNATNLVCSSVWAATQACTASSVSSSLNPSTFGQAVSFTATVTGNSPTGTVQFNVDGSAFGSPVTLSSGSATSNSTSTLTVGTHTVTAVYSGDSKNLGNTGTLSGGQVVGSATSGTVVTSSGSPSAYGQSVTFTATINGEYGLLKNRKKGPKAEDVTGTVTWSANTGCGTTPVTTGNPGIATCITSSLAVGTQTITGAYSGDSNHSGSTGTLSGGQVVNQAATSLSVTSVSPASEGYGQDQQITITAVLSWAGSGTAPTASAVTIGGNGPSGNYGTTTCGAPSGDTITCTNTYTPTAADTPGSYTESASFTGDSNYTGSSSSQTNNFAITSATSSTSVTSSVNPSTYGQSVTFTATISGEYGLLKERQGRQKVAKRQDVSGTVAWSSNTGCGTTPVTTGNPGTATCTTSSLPVGTDTITANYSGDSDHSASTGTLSGGQVVQSGASTSINVTSVSPASEAYGQDQQITITAVLSWTGSGAAPTASAVTIGGNGPSGTYGTTTCGAPSGDTMTCTNTYTPTAADAPGSYTESATFAGDSNYGGSSSPQTNNFAITSATSSTSVTSSVNPSSYGQLVTFTATISGEYGQLKGRQKVPKRQDVTGTVAWSSNTGCGTTPVTTGNPGTATCTTSSLPVGTDQITANYSGDSNHGGSTGTLSGGQVVQSGAGTSINVTSVSPAAEGYGSDQQITITAVLSWTGSGVAPTASAISIGGNGPSGTYGTTTCGAPSGDTITCTSTYTPSTLDIAGTYTEMAKFAGDSNYGASTSPQVNNFTITQATSSTSVASSLNPSTYGQSVTFTATINGEFGQVKGQKVAKRQDVTGSVTWSTNTGCGTTPVTTGNPGTATCKTSTLPGGTDTITANYSGDSNHSGSTGTLSGGQVVNPATQTITFSMNAPTQAVYGTSFTVAASASSGLPITYGSSGSCSNSGPVYTMTSGTGTCTVTASQPGNNNYQAATPVSENTTAERANQMVSFTGAPAEAPYNGTFVMLASTDASTVAYITSNNPTVCSLSGPYSPVTVTMLKDTGKCTFTAQWGADQNYNPATATQKTTAEKATPVITWATPAAITYGTALSGTQLDASANVAGSFVYSPAAGKIEPAGNDTLDVKFTPSNANYSTTTASVTLQVNQAATVTTITSSSQTITLTKKGTAVTTLDFHVTSYEPTGSVSLTASTGETCSGTLTPASGNGLCKLTFSSTGTRTITATYGGDANHTSSNNSGQNPPVTVTVDPY